MKKSRYEYPVPEHQADAVLNQANPGSGTQYEVLPTTRNVRIISISVVCTWTVQPTPLEIHVTLNGQTLRFAVTNPASGTSYYAVWMGNNAPNAQLLDTTHWEQTRGFLVEARSVRITAEITGGTVSNLSARVIYAKW